MTDIIKLTAAETAAKIASGELTAVQVTEAHLANERRLLASLTESEQRRLADLMRKLRLGLPD